MIVRYLTILFLLGILLSSSCGTDYRSKSPVGLTVTGKVGEILVVCEQGIWNSEIKSYLDSGLTQWILPYLPDVATFTLIHKTPGHFTQGVKRYRNTLFIDIDPNYNGEHGSITKREDVWAKDQLVIDLKAKDFNQMLETCKFGLEEVHEEFDQIEWQRIIRKFKRNNNAAIRDRVKKNFGIDLALPSGSEILSARTNFFRIEFPMMSRPIEFVGSGTQDNGSIVSGIMIYQYDYTDSSQFEMSNLLRARDTMLKYNVPHEIEGMYMGTQYAMVFYPDGNESTSFDGKTTGYDVRGMFMFKGKPINSTGGAFWAFHFLNKRTKKLLCISGYVDAPPTTSWTHPLREIQAILRSVEVIK